MARITWQNVEAPRMSLYDYSQMNQTLNSAFRNLGDSITGIQEGHRDRVIDRNVGNLMRINDLDQLRSASTNYGGPYARQVLEAAQAREKFLREGRQADLTYDTGVENLAQTRAVNQSGELIARSQLAGYGGQELDPILASADPELRRRVGSLMSDAWTGAAENTRTHNQTALRDDRAHNRGMAQIGLQRERLAMDKVAHERQEQARQEALRGEQDAMAQIQNGDPSLSTEDWLSTYMRSGDYLNQSPEYRRAFEQAITSTRDTYLSPTEEQRLNSALGASGITDDTAIASAAATNMAAGQSLALSAMQAGERHQDVTADHLVSRLVAQDMSEEAARKLVNQGIAQGVPLNVQAGMLDSAPTGNTAWYRNPKFFLGGVLNPLVWRDQFFGAEREFNKNLERVVEERSSGDLARSQAELNQQLAPLQRIDNQLKYYSERAEREMAANGVPKAETAAAIEQLMLEAQDYRERYTQPRR